jgi:hypothetical protein
MINQHWSGLMTVDQLPADTAPGVRVVDLAEEPAAPALVSAPDRTVIERAVQHAKKEVERRTEGLKYHQRYIAERLAHIDELREEEVVLKRELDSWKLLQATVKELLAAQPCSLCAEPCQFCPPVSAAPAD